MGSAGVSKINLFDNLDQKQMVSSRVVLSVVTDSGSAMYSDSLGIDLDVKIVDYLVILVSGASSSIVLLFVAGVSIF